MKEKAYVKKVTDLVLKQVSKPRDVIEGYVAFYAKGAIAKGESSKSLADWIIADFKKVQS